MPVPTADRPRSLRRSIDLLRADHRTVAQAARFVVVGGSNTVFTFLLFVALQQVLVARVAYTISYAAGLAYTTAMTPRFVFRAQARLNALARFVAWYLCMYLLGLFIVHVTRDEWHSAWITAACTFAATAPLTFFVGRRLFRVRTPELAGAAPAAIAVAPPVALAPTSPGAATPACAPDAAGAPEPAAP